MNPEKPPTVVASVLRIQPGLNTKLHSGNGPVRFLPIGCRTRSCVEKLGIHSAVGASCFHLPFKTGQNGFEEGILNECHNGLPGGSIINGDGIMRCSEADYRESLSTCVSG